MNVAVLNIAKPSILVVDDNPLIVNVLRNLLLSVDYSVHSAKNGEEAVSVLDTQDVDVVICDVMMPKMDGYELHTAIRKKAKFSHIPFIFLTALDDQSEVRRGQEVGADEYLVKPFQPEELLAIVRGKVARSRSLRELSEEKFDAYKKRVIHTLSHEFRTPLVAINTGAELLLDQHSHFNPDRVKSLLEAVHRGGVRLERLVGDFMLLQQIEAGIAKRMFEGKACKLQIGELAKNFVENMREELSAAEFKIYFTDQSENALVQVYQTQIIDVLTRLTRNSIKFSHNQKEIDFNVVKYQDSQVSIEVLDRGIGIDLKRIKEAIDVFGQIDRDKLEQQGSGLGLAIASRYAEINRGRLEFSNREGGGSKVSLILPIVE